MGGKQPLKIPFSSKDPRYNKCWKLIRRQGLSLDEAVARVQAGPAKRELPSVSSSANIAASSKVKDPTTKEKKRHHRTVLFDSAPDGKPFPMGLQGKGLSALQGRLKDKPRSSAITAKGLLSHPGVPENVKEHLKQPESPNPVLELPASSTPAHTSDIKLEEIDQTETKELISNEFTKGLSIETFLPWLVDLQTSHNVLLREYIRTTGEVRDELRRLNKRLDARGVAL